MLCVIVGVWLSVCYVYCCLYVVVSVRLLSRTSVCFVVYRVYPALCAWLMAA